jgi:hypothetical protein
MRDSGNVSDDDDNTSDDPRDDDEDAGGTQPSGNSSKAGNSANQGKKKRGPRGGYRNYTDTQIEDLLTLRFDQQLTISKAAASLGIKTRTAAQLIKRYMEDEEESLSTKSKHRVRGVKPILQTHHTEFIIEYLENNQLTVVVEVWDALHKQFDDIKVSKSTVSRTALSLTLTRPRCRVSPSPI